jgi:hypothetical protein
MKDPCEDNGAMTKYQVDGRKTCIWPGTGIEYPYPPIDRVPVLQDVRPNLSLAPGDRCRREVGGCGQ